METRLYEKGIWKVAGITACLFTTIFDFGQPFSNKWCHETATLGNLLQNFALDFLFQEFSCFVKSFNPIRRGLFSRSPGPGGGGGSEARMPKIKVKINWLKLNFAWVIISIKAFLMQNLRLIALLVLEIWRHKIFLKRRERVIRFDYLSLENGFNFKKKRVFMSRIVLLDPKLTLHVNFNNFQAEENFFIFKIFGTSRWRKSSSNSLDWSILLKFGQNVP